MACLLEVGAAKAGNVHPGKEFADTGLMDFAVSAVAIAPAMERAAEAGVGRAVLEAVRATQEAVKKNTNLGMLLLLAPLCAAGLEGNLRDGVRRVLSSMSMDDAACVYEAIRLAKPGGLGKAEKGDVSEAPPLPLLEAMKLAADRDAVARQYVNGFEDVFNRVTPSLVAAVRDGLGMGDAIVRAHLQQMAREPDSLIRRKCGDALAVESSHRARAVLDASWPHTAGSRAAFDEFDAWLRGDGNRRNPGTSADLIAAGLYVALRDNLIERSAGAGDPWAGALS
ncbi:MAG: triphosphoribosyl-dephospho-CoA synthase [Planctomycetes bacterium]|nr:triphosphoribosyl-dephospho-CoA synthase [Planctomycetota bacterium]